MSRNQLAYKNVQSCFHVYSNVSGLFVVQFVCWPLFLWSSVIRVSVCAMYLSSVFSRLCFTDINSTSESCCRCGHPNQLTQAHCSSNFLSSKGTMNICIWKFKIYFLRNGRKDSLLTPACRLKGSCPQKVICCV